jgi:hypothetical protein
MPARTPEERSLVARIAVAERWAHTPDRTQATQYMRDARRAKIAAAITAAIGELAPDELNRRVDDKIRADMLRLSLKSAQARRRSREQKAIADAAEAELADFGNGAA